MTFLKIPFVVLTLAGTIAHARGPSTGGGGNVCYHPALGNKPILLALAINSDKAISQRDQTPGIKLQKTNTLKNLGIDSVDLTPVIQAATKKLDPYAHTQGAQFLLKAMGILRFYLMEGSSTTFSEASFNPEKPECSETNVRAGAFFTGSQVVLFRSVWNNSSLETQVGIVLTEAARVVQIRYQTGGSNSDLQNLVAKIMDQDVSFQIDASPFFGTAFAKRGEPKSCAYFHYDYFVSRRSPLAQDIRQVCVNKDLSVIPRLLKTAHAQRLEQFRKVPSHEPVITDEAREEAFELLRVGNLILKLQNLGLGSYLDQMQENTPDFVNATIAIEDLNLEALVAAARQKFVR